MADRTCKRCGKEFSKPYWLRKHQERKTPCASILEKEDLPEGVLADPELEKKKCRFCGRVFSSYTAMRRHVRQNCGIAPNAKNGDIGMEKLYEHTARMQEARIAALETQNAEMMALVREQSTQMALVREQSTQMAQLAAGRMVAPVGGPAITAGDGNRILQDNRQNNINIHIHGQESLAHLTGAKVRGLLDDAICAPELPQAASQAIVRAAMLVYSDPEHPENLTAYLPNKKLNDALVHTEEGWEVQPTSLVLPPMAQKCVDALFAEQPYEDADEYAPLLKELADNEARYTAGSDLRPILIRNKDLLNRALGTLPVAGQGSG